MPFSPTAQEMLLDTLPEVIRVILLLPSASNENGTPTRRTKRTYDDLSFMFQDSNTLLVLNINLVFVKRMHMLTPISTDIIMKDPISTNNYFPNS